MSDILDKPNSQGTYWFYKWPLWVRIVLCIFLLPIFVPILVWPKLKLPMWGKITILVIWIIVMLGISGLSSASENNKDIVLNVTGISENEVRKDDKLSLKIKTDPIVVDEVTVNGEAATKNGWDNDYSLDKTFPEGDNKIVVVAKKGDKMTEKIFNFKVDLGERKFLEKYQLDIKELEQIYYDITEIEIRAIWDADKKYPNYGMEHSEYSDTLIRQRVTAYLEGFGMVYRDTTTIGIIATQNDFQGWDKSEEYRIEKRKI